MTWLFDKANQYLAESDWKDLALVKFCLCAMGVLIGLNVPKKHKDVTTGFAAGVFSVTYVLLMSKFGKILLRKE